jgi:DNA-binding MarR family transcriptional regulator
LPHYEFDTYDAYSSLGYLVKRCGGLMSAAAEKAFDGQDLSYTQWVVLIRLRANGAPLSATSLSDCLGHDPGALTRVVDGLERGGLVKRERSLTDRRVVAIELTPAGLAEAEKALRRVIGMMNILLEPFSPDEVKTLTSLLIRLQRRLLEQTCAFPESQG